MKLQSILYPAKGESTDDEQLYFHRNGEWINVDGYLNLFYLEKHHKYCRLNELFLELELNGVRKVQLMHERDCVYEFDLETGSEKASTCSKLGKHGFKRYTLKFPYSENKKGVFWFRILPSSDDFFCAGHYSATTDFLNDVRIAVNICTFKREKYVLRNMKALSDWAKSADIDGKQFDVADKLNVFLIDNGQTLEDNAEMNDLLQDTRVQIEIIPNANTGGCGGFSRGMKEAISRRTRLGITHLLMMDDDAVFNPDIFVRLYGFLSTLRNEYEEITVGGALMREDYRYIQHANGEWFSKYKVINDNPLCDMRVFENCTDDLMTGTEKEHKLYGAWWCCCYHMNAITKENIPLPIFVHHDDIQFGMKQTERGIVFLNGVCVWHQGFELVFPGVKQYYNMRNTLITMQMYEPEYLKKTMLIWSIRRYIGMLISYRYADCEFVYRGFVDFLRGKEWLLDSDPEMLHRELMEIYKTINNFVGIDEMGLEKSSRAIVMKKAAEFGDIISPDLLREYYSSERFNGSLRKKITFNGWFLPPRKKLRVITPFDSPWDTFRYKEVCLYEPASKKGTLVRRSNRELFKGISRIFYMSVLAMRWKILGCKW